MLEALADLAEMSPLFFRSNLVSCPYVHTYVIILFDLHTDEHVGSKSRDEFDNGGRFRHDRCLLRKRCLR